MSTLSGITTARFEASIDKAVCPLHQKVIFIYALEFNEETYMVMDVLRIV